MTAAVATAVALATAARGLDYASVDHIIKPLRKQELREITGVLAALSGFLAAGAQVDVLPALGQLAAEQRL